MCHLCSPTAYLWVSKQDTDGKHRHRLSPLHTYRWSHGWDLWVCVGMAALLGSPKTLLVHPDPQARLSPEQKLAVWEVGTRRGCCSDLMSSRGGCRDEVSGQGRGTSACNGRKGGRGWLWFTPEGGSSEITQASWILNPRCLFGRGSEGFSILQGLQMGLGLLPSDGSGYLQDGCF